MTYSGVILDSTTETPIPSATVYAFVGNTRIGATAADGNGNFSLTTALPADTLVISAAEFTPMQFPASPYQNRFELERKDPTLDNVTVTSHSKKSNYLLLLALLPLLMQKKKKVGAVSSDTIVLVGGGLLAFGMLKEVLAKFGFGTGPGSHQAAAEQANPNSPWKPAYWRSGPQNELIIQEAPVQQMIATIHGAFHLYMDDFNAIFSTFSQLRTKSQVSYLSEKFTQRYNEDLLSYLTDGGGFLPWDGLSDSHLKTLTDFVSNLPNYTP